MNETRKIMLINVLCGRVSIRFTSCHACCCVAESLIPRLPSTPISTVFDSSDSDPRTRFTPPPHVATRVEGRVEREWRHGVCRMGLCAASMSAFNAPSLTVPAAVPTAADSDRRTDFTPLQPAVPIQGVSEGVSHG
jgi:hypothetical protein